MSDGPAFVAFEAETIDRRHPLAGDATPVARRGTVPVALGVCLVALAVGLRRR